MVDTITESFCERCGTRYEFKAPTRLNPLRKTRGLIGGLKNYVMSQDALGDAIGDSMRSEEEQLAAAQLDAFHQSFNFCIDCRQYTCLNCWNDAAGRCRSCVPIPGTDDLAERLAAGMPGAAPADAIAAPVLDEFEADAAIGLESWPTSDLPDVAEPALHATVPEAWPVADGFVYETPQTAEEPVRAADGFVYEGPVQVELPDDVAALAEPEVEAQPIAAEIELEPVLAEEVEPEPVVAEELEAEPVVAEELEPEPMLAEELDPEPVVAEDAEPEPEPVAAPRRFAPISETILRFPQRPVQPPTERESVAAESDSPDVAARRAQLDLLGLGDPGEGPVQEARPGVLPYRSRGSGVTQGELAARAAAHGATFWEASAREVASAVGNVGVQNCGQCGLSLSANARFCRRCGTRQAQSA